MKMSFVEIPAVRTIIMRRTLSVFSLILGNFLVCKTGDCNNQECDFGESMSPI